MFGGERRMEKGCSVMVSGISPWKEMDDAVYVRGVADVTLFKFEIDIFFDAVHLHGKGRSTRKVIYDGTGRRKIDRC